MTAEELITEVRALGVELRPAPDGSRILYRPRDALSPEWVERLREHKPQVLALLSEFEAQVQWRAAEMRGQIPPSGPIGYLCARPRTAAHDTPGHCGSCGEPKEPGQRYVCVACGRAKWLALNETRELVDAAGDPGDRQS
jgi:hypothetical protein